MKVIYESSAAAYISLGQGSNDSNIAMRMVVHYDEAWKIRSPELKQCSVQDEHKSEYLKLVEKELHSGERRAVEALTRLFLRGWWRRVWIVQETVLAPVLELQLHSHWPSYSAILLGRPTRCAYSECLLGV